MMNLRSQFYTDSVVTPNYYDFKHIFPFYNKPIQSMTPQHCQLLLNTHKQFVEYNFSKWNLGKDGRHSTTPLSI